MILKLLQMNLTRKQILREKYKYPSDLVRLKPTTHFIERLQQRGYSLNCVPTMVRVTDSNIHSAKINENNSIVSVVVRLNYSSSKFIFVCFNPNDGALKTLWFKDKRNENKPGNLYRTSR